MPTQSHKEDLLQRLAVCDYAAKYLKASFEEGDEAGFLLALRNVVEAHSGISKVARESKVTRQHLHRVLTEEGNPTLSTLKSILEAVGLTLDFSPQDLCQALS